MTIFVPTEQDELIMQGLQPMFRKMYCTTSNRKAFILESFYKEDDVLYVNRKHFTGPMQEDYAFATMPAEQLLQEYQEGKWIEKTWEAQVVQRQCKTEKL